MCQRALEAVASNDPLAVRRLIEACAAARDFADQIARMVTADVGAKRVAG